MQVMLRNTCEFCKNWYRNGRTFLMGVNEITFYAGRVTPYDILKGKNTCVKDVHSIVKYINLVVSNLYEHQSCAG
jgi:hypothetical protein